MSLINDALVRTGRETATADITVPGIVFRGDGLRQDRAKSALNLTRFTSLLAVTVFLASMALGAFWLRSNSNRFKLPQFVRTLLVLGEPVSKAPVSVHARSGAPVNPPAATPAPASPAAQPLPQADLPPSHPKSGILPKVMSMLNNLASGKHSGGDDDDLKLQAIIYCPGKSSVVINGQTAYVGENIANAKIRSIGPNSVVILCSTGRTNILELR